MTASVQLEGPHWDLADYLRKSLRDADLGVIEIADELGVSRTSVSNWINGRNVPSRPTLRAWALRTGMPYEWLCAARDSNPEPAD